MVDTIFPAKRGDASFIGFNDTDDSLEKVYGQNSHGSYAWRDDILWCRNHIESLDETIRLFCNKPRTSQVRVFPSCRILFWNLFLTAIDDEIYADELSNVLDLAYIIGLNENIISDLCGGVKYILEGNRLHKDCDLRCETAEGRCFLLHDYTTWTSCGAGYGLAAINNY